MVPNVLASKLPARKSRNIARDKMRVRVVNKRVVSRRKNWKFVSQKWSVQCSMGTKLAEKGRKTILEKRKEEGEVGSPARKAQRLRSVGHNLFQVESSEHFESVNFVIKTVTNKHSQIARRKLKNKMNKMLGPESCI